MGETDIWGIGVKHICEFFVPFLQLFLSIKLSQEFSKVIREIGKILYAISWVLL